VIGALTIFYSILVVSLLVPILGGLYWQRAGTSAAMVSIVSGLVTLFSVRLFVTTVYRWADPALSGLLIAAVVYVVVTLMGRPSTHVRSVHA